MKKRGLCMVLAAAMLGSVIAGCTNKEVDEQTGGKEVIKWIMPGPGEQEDSKEVWKTFNEKLKEYPGMENIEVDIEVISSADYKQKFLMMQTSGSEQIDILQTYTLDFVTEAKNGTFAPLDEFLDDELKQTKEQLPEFVFEYGKIDGVTYQIPNYQMCAGLGNIRLNKEIADKYIDIQDLKDAFKNTTDSKAVMDILEVMLEKAKVNGELGMGFNPDYVDQFATREFDQIANYYVIRKDDEKCNVFEMHKAPEVKELYERMRSWFEKGYIRKDILSAADLHADNGKKGGYIIYMDNTYSGKDVEVTADGVEEYSILRVQSPFIGVTNGAGGLAIFHNSKHKSAAAKVINLMNSEEGKDLYNLLVYGFEDVHYKKINDDRVEPFDYDTQGSSSAKYGLWKWVVGNTKNAWLVPTNDDNYKEFVFDYINEGEDTVVSRMIGFNVDVTNFASNMSQLAAVVSEYNNPLAWGALENWETVYDEFMNKIDKCGNEMITEEIQKQVDEFNSKK